MPSLASCVTLTELGTQSLQMNFETREVRLESVVYAAAKKGHGPNCKCEACSTLHMQRTKDMRTKKLKAMMPGNVDQGNRQTPMSSKKMKADFNLTMKKVKAKIQSGGPGSGRRAEHDIGNIAKRYAEDQKQFKKLKKVKAKLDKGNKKTKQVPPPKQKVDTIKPSELMHEKGKILKG